MPTVQPSTDPATPEVVAPSAAVPVAPPAPVPAPFPEAPQAPSVPPAMKKLSTRKVYLGFPPLPSTSGLFVDQEDRLDQLACVRDRRRTNRRPSASWSESTLLDVSPDYRRPDIRGRALRRSSSPRRRSPECAVRTRRISPTHKRHRSTS